jgi:hypothetical protein
MTSLGKLAAAISGMMVVSLTADLVAIRTIATVRTAAVQNMTKSARMLELAGAMSTGLAMTRFAQRGILLYTMAREPTEASAQKLRMRASLNSIRHSLEATRPLIDSPQMGAELEEFEQALNNYQELAAEIVRDVDAGRLADATAVLKNKSKPFGAFMEKESTSLSERARNSTAEAAGEVARDTARGQWLLLALLAAQILVAGGAFTIMWRVRRSLGRATGQLNEAAQQVRGAASHVADGSKALANGAMTQAAALEQTSAAIKEISVTTASNAGSSAEAAACVGEINRRTQDTAAAIQQMLVSMEQIGASGDRISRIVKAIEGIAFQTNLLALNAAVEAARAGSAGAGFAVVADEVRNLAHRCSDAVSETTVVIGESLSSSREGRVQVDRVAALAGEVTAGAARALRLVDDVNGGCQRQSAAIGQISQALASIQEVTQATASGAEESAAASEEMLAQAESISRIAAGVRRLVDDREPVNA